MESDAELVARVRRGDLAAFGLLSARYERTVLAAALANLRDIHIAEDVVQATLLAAFRRLETLREGGRFGAWLMQIARHQMIDVARDRRTPPAAPLDDTDYPLCDDPRIQTWIDNEFLTSLVARLGEDEQLLIGLRYFDGHSMAEIATILARPIGSVTKQISRVIAQLNAWCVKENAQ